MDLRSKLLARPRHGAVEPDADPRGGCEPRLVHKMPTGGPNTRRGQTGMIPGEPSIVEHRTFDGKRRASRNGVVEGDLRGKSRLAADTGGYLRVSGYALRSRTETVRSAPRVVVGLWSGFALPGRARMSGRLSSQATHCVCPRIVFVCAPTDARATMACCTRHTDLAPHAHRARTDTMRQDAAFTKCVLRAPCRGGFCASKDEVSRRASRLRSG